MSFYRSLLAAIAAVALVAPVFADDTTTTTTTDTQQAAPTEQMTSTTTTTTTEQTKIDINKATTKDLMKVHGLNATKAKAIVVYRKKHGDFKTLDDLAKVKGFTKLDANALKSIQDQLTLE